MEDKLYQITEKEMYGTRQKLVVGKSTEEIKKKWEKKYWGKSSLTLQNVEDFIVEDSITGKKYKVLRLEETTN